MPELKLPCGRPPARKAHPTEEQLETWHQALRDYLTEHKLKYTVQRWQIARSILLAGGHMDAHGISERVKSERPGIGPATVYRTLKLLVDAGILVKSFEDRNGRAIYELAGNNHHDHLICLDCNAIFEFESEAIEREQAALGQKQKFDVQGHQHVLYARCRYKV